MAVRYNDNKEIVEKIKEGLKKKGGYCPCKIEKHPKTSVCARSFATR